MNLEESIARVVLLSIWEWLATDRAALLIVSVLLAVLIVAGAWMLGSAIDIMRGDDDE